MIMKWINRGHELDAIAKEYTKKKAMKQYKNVELFMEPCSILEKVCPGGQATGMTASERGFICGLIRDYQPQKIVEVGVAEGETTVVILECIRRLALKSSLYSVDLSERVYHDQRRCTGDLVDRLAEHSGASAVERHHLMLGKLLADRLEEIGSEIDFLILDTMHIMPGEILDFIAAFPHLSCNAIVVLHDTRYHYMRREQAGIATSVLLQSVTADKFLNNQKSYPNIAAFQLNDDTMEYMTDVFCLLMIRWAYIPLEEHLRSYEAVISAHYNAQCHKLFLQAETEAKKYHYGSQMPSIGGFQHVLLYGAGNRGQEFYRQCNAIGIKVDGFVVSDEQFEKSFHSDAEGKTPTLKAWNPDRDGPSGYKLVVQTRGSESLPIYSYSQIPFSPEETLIIQTAKAPEVTQRLQMSKWHWIDFPMIFWKELGF